MEVSSITFRAQSILHMPVGLLICTWISMLPSIPHPRDYSAQNHLPSSCSNSFALEPESLIPLVYAPVPPGAIRPLGWMRAQLEAQQQGLVGRKWLGDGAHTSDSNWVGGSGYEGLAESYPYWLNGAVPLAALLDNTTALEEIRADMDFILEAANSTTADGWLGPLVDGDPWSSFRFLVCLAEYGRLVPDYEQAPKAGFRFASRLLSYLKEKPLVSGSWAHSRWQELLEGYQLLLDYHGSLASANERTAVFELMDLAREQGFDWVTWLASDETHPFIDIPAKNITPTGYIIGHDIPNNDLEVVQLESTANATECERLCNASTDCRAFVWGPEGCGDLKFNTCWLKSDVGPSTPNACRNYRVMGGISKFRGWFPNNTRDSDSIGYDHWMPHLNRQWVHGVNIAQALGTWGTLYRTSGNTSILVQGRQAWTKLLRLHGQANGAFSGDETLAGLLPERGVETCLVVEMMNQAANMFHTTGDVFYADQLELLALNALPAAFMNGTMWSLNYYQQVNKLDAMDGQPDCEHGCVYCFGLVYECCVTNHAQGWPKYVGRQYLTAPATNTKPPVLAIAQYFSSTTRQPIPVGPTNLVSVSVDTRYPFEEQVRINVTTESSLSLHLRIPSWCGSASVSVDGVPSHSHPNAGEMFVVELPQGLSQILLTFPMEIRIETRPPYLLSIDKSIDTKAVNVFRGPLLFAAPRDYILDHSKPFDNGPDTLPLGQAHGQDNYLLGRGTWNHALHLSSGNLSHSSRFHSHFPELPHGQGPFAQSLAPVSITIDVVEISQWDVIRDPNARGAIMQCDPNTTSEEEYSAVWASTPPVSPIHSTAKPRTVTLIPYGATDLRIAEFPYHLS